MRLLRFYLLDNPVFRREVRRRAWQRAMLRSPLWGAAVVGLVIGEAWIWQTLFGDPGREVVLHAIALVALCVVAVVAGVRPATAAANSMARERLSGSLRDVSTTPLRASQVLAGKMATVLLPTWAVIVLPLVCAWAASRARLLAEVPLDLELPGFVVELLVGPSARYWLVWVAGAVAVTFLSAAIGSLTGATFRFAGMGRAVAVLLVALLACGVWSAHHRIIEPALIDHGRLGAASAVGWLLPWLAYLALAAVFFAGAHWRLARLMRGEGD